MSAPSGRPSEALSRDAVQAQRAAKKAETQQRQQAAAEKKLKEEQIKASGGIGSAAQKQSIKSSKPSTPSHSLTPQSGSPNIQPIFNSNTPTAFTLERRESTSSKSGKPTLLKESSTSSSTGISSSSSAAGVGPKRHAPLMQFDDPKKVAIFDRKAVVQRTAVQKQVPLFSHLPQYERESSLSLKLKVGFSSDEIHPSILRIGLQYASGNISGSNSRCVAMLTAFKQFISDYTTPPSKILRDDLLSKLKPLVRFLIDSRPQSISMGNALRYLKMRISKIGVGISEEKAKQSLISDINSFIQERIEFADEVIATHGVSKINEGDVILTYATSHVVEMIFKKAHSEGKQFKLIIVDSRPKLEGKELLRRLLQYGIKCTYIMINALSYVMKEVNKVFLGAAAVLSNGNVISRVGSAVVSMMAHTNNVPLLVCCETYKFHERVQLDSIGFNELGDPDELILSEQDGNSCTDGLSDWRDLPNIKLLNLAFDLTPVQFVTMIITEVGMIPPTSVPVILRGHCTAHNHANHIQCVRVKCIVGDVVDFILWI